MKLNFMKRRKGNTLIMRGGLMQLVAYGARDIYLTGNWVEDNEKRQAKVRETLRLDKLKQLAKKFKKLYYRGKVNQVLLKLYQEIRYLPGNSGYLEAKAEFMNELSTLPKN